MNYKIKLYIFKDIELDCNCNIDKRFRKKEKEEEEECYHFKKSSNSLKQFHKSF